MTIIDAHKPDIFRSTNNKDNAREGFLLIKETKKENA